MVFIFAFFPCQVTLFFYTKTVISFYKGDSAYIFYNISDIKKGENFKGQSWTYSTSEYSLYPIPLSEIPTSPISIKGSFISTPP